MKALKAWHREPMNPLGLPKWKSSSPTASTPPKTPPSFGDSYDGDIVTGGLTDAKPVRQVPFISLSDEARRAAAQAAHIITLQVVGGETVKMAWVKGQRLGDYLSQVGLKGTSLRKAVYDLNNLSAGRLRLYYEPPRGAHIRIQSASMGVQFEHQTNRNQDIERLAANMGSKGGSTAPKVVEFNLTYGPPQETREDDEHCGVPQV